MMPESDLWPMSESWNIRLHKAFYPQARKALFSRYGEPKGVEEYSMKSQVLQYEATRGLFEAFAANKYRSSGIIYWMYNSAWPTMYWQLYDYFYAPNGSFYGTKKACENLHIQYSYDDNSIRVVNGNYKDFYGLKATAKLYNMNMGEIYSTEAPVEIKSDESRKVFTVERPIGADDITFLKLVLSNNEGKEISSNFYWLSSKGDENADFTALSSLSETELNFSVTSVKQENGKYSAVVEIENPSGSLAFFVNPKIIKNTSKELVLPVFWEDNYFSLLPKEKRSIKVAFAAENLDGAAPILALDGWNIKKTEKELK
jgi:exo-1,4-beta-D-glucosaminidase